jgi:hypothetical protein
MLNLKKLQASTALALTLGVTSTSVAPLAIAGAASATPAPQKVAQLFPSRPSSQPTTYSVRIPAGASLPLTYDKAEKIVIAPNETVPITLTIARNVRSSSGTLLIPAGSQVEGEFRPANDNNSQFVSRTLILTNGTRLPIDGRSDVLSRKETIRKGTNVTSVLKGAAIGAGASAIIEGITGNRRIATGSVLIGSGLGALSGLFLGRNRAEVVVVQPRVDNLSLTLNSSLALNNY